MKATHVIILNQWVIENKEKLSCSGRGTLSECASSASEELGFKVPTSAMRDLMLENGIETKRQSRNKSKELAMLGEIEKLTAENMQLRRTLAKVVASELIPEDLKELLFAGLNDEVKAAILSNPAARPVSNA